MKKQVQKINKISEEYSNNSPLFFKTPVSPSPPSLLKSLWLVLSHPSSKVLSPSLRRMLFFHPDNSYAATWKPIISLPIRQTHTSLVCISLSHFPVVLYIFLPSRVVVNLNFCCSLWSSQCHHGGLCRITLGCLNVPFLLSCLLTLASLCNQLAENPPGYPHCQHLNGPISCYIMILSFPGTVVPLGEVPNWSEPAFTEGKHQRSHCN